MERDYMTADQRFAATRPDVLVYQTRNLDKDITFAGNLVANLSVSTTGTDADWVVKVIDVYPDSTTNNVWTKGTVMSAYQQMIRSEAFKGKFRNSLTSPNLSFPGRLRR